MALWVDKYRPRDFPKLTFHKEQAEQLISLVSTSDFPHLLFCGPSGAGKRTRIHCLLKKLYGKGVENVHVEEIPFTVPSGKKLQIHSVNSNYHIELTPSDVGIYDRVIVQEVVKTMAQVEQLNRTAQKAFKVVVLMEAENLSREAQQSLRRTMEKYAGTCKIVLCCESASRVIDPLRSRCMLIRVAAPSDAEMRACIEFVCAKEHVNLSEFWMKLLIEKAAGNVRRAICLLEGSVAQHGKDLVKQSVMEPEWETYLKQTAELIMQKKNANGVLEVRQRFYELLCRCIPPSVIFINLVDELSKMCDRSLVGPLVTAAARYEHSSKLGSKEIYHLEAFVATFMELACAHQQS
ncbi:Subunit of heteropentameric Replication factor C (RF-C) [Globodera pallida]|nr:Subunit of heteropentameric Replication factor C (RF-C) [Globodera pallida]